MTPDAPRDPYSVAWPTLVLPTPGQRWGLLVSSIPPTPCLGLDGELFQQVGNPYPYSIFIRQIRVWNGVDLEAKVDLWTRIWACGGIYDPPMVIWSHNWDRYLPTAFHQPFEQDFGDGYVELVAGGWLTFSTIATAIGPQWNPIDQVFYTPSYGTQFMLWFEAVRPRKDDL